MLQALFNIAGIAQYSDLETVTAEDLQRCFTVNAIGPILVVQSLLKEGVLQDQALIANMTSKVPGSTFATAMIQAVSLQSTGSGPDRDTVLNQCHQGNGLQMGSMGDNTSGGSYAYRCSKAALNAATKSMSIDLKERGMTVVTLHPGG